LKHITNGQAVHYQNKAVKILEEWFSISINMIAKLRTKVNDN